MAAKASKVNGLIVQCNLQSLVLEQETIDVRNIPAQQLFHVDFEGTQVGPVFIENLKEFMQEHPDVFPLLKIKNQTEETWKPASVHPQFQRRSTNRGKAAPVATNTYDDKYYILKLGEKTGPFTYADLESKIHSKEVLYTDMVCINNGHSWIKMHELEVFNRRERKDEDTPPALPQADVFNNSDREVFQNLQGQAKDHAYAEAIAGLAYIGQMKEGDHTVYKGANSVGKAEHVATTVESRPPTNWKGVKVVAMSFTIILAAGVLAFNLFGKSGRKMASDSNMESDANISNNDSASNGEQAETKTGNSRRSKPGNTSRRTRELAQVDEENNGKKQKRGRSFGRGKNYRMPSNKDLANEPSGDDNDDFYESDSDSDDPVELDPVQNKLSKETIDPESDGSENKASNDASPPSDEEQPED